MGGIFAGWNFRGWNFRGWNFPGTPRAIPLFFRQRSTVGTGGGGGVTGETRGSRPGVPLNKSIGDGTSGSVGRAGGPGVRVGGFAGGVLAAGCSQGGRGMGSFVGERGGSRGAVGKGIRG